MIRRFFWFLVGLVSGVYATIWVRRTVDDVADKLSPTALVDQVIHVLKALATAAMSGAGFLVETVSNRGPRPGRSSHTPQ